MYIHEEQNDMPVIQTQELNVHCMLRYNVITVYEYGLTLRLGKRSAAWIAWLRTSAAAPVPISCLPVMISCNCHDALQVHVLSSMSMMYADLLAKNHLQSRV